MSEHIDALEVLQFAGADADAAPGSVAHSLAMVAKQYGEVQADARRWREVSDKAWFIDAAAYVYGLRTGTFEPTPDEDELLAAIDAAISQHERS